MNELNEEQTTLAALRVKQEHHEFTEDVADGSMCVCGIPALYHEAWESSPAAPTGEEQ